MLIFIEIKVCSYLLRLTITIINQKWNVEKKCLYIFTRTSLFMFNEDPPKQTTDMYVKTILFDTRHYILANRLDIERIIFQAIVAHKTIKYRLFYRNLCSNKTSLWATHDYLSCIQINEKQ